MYWLIPLELVHWTRSLRAIRRTDMLIMAGTGIVSDHLCGPLGWPYEIFELSMLAALCRVRVAFLSVGVGPLRNPLSRWFIKRGLSHAHHRSYRGPNVGVRTQLLAAVVRQLGGTDWKRLCGNCRNLILVAALGDGQATQRSSLVFTSFHQFVGRC